MTETENVHLLSLPPAKVSVAQIPDTLDGLWESLGQDLSDDGQAVTRACMSNLIIYCDNEEQSRDIETSVAGIVLEHPCRVLLLVGEGKPSEGGIEVYVSGQYFALSSGWQVCAEQVKVVTDAASNRRLASVARSKLVGDLPTTLWWASSQPPPFAGKLFYNLTEMSDQIIYDSVGWTNPTKGMQAMSRWVVAESSEYVIFNLAWRRLKHWRNFLSQVLDPSTQPDTLEQVSRVTIQHGPHALAVALLLLGWLASRLGWTPVEGSISLGKETVWHFNVAGRKVPVTIQRLSSGNPTISCLQWNWRKQQQDHRVDFAMLGSERIGIVEETSDVPMRVMSAPCQQRSKLVAAQMAHRTRDKIFESALEVGNAMTSILGN